MTAQSSQNSWLTHLVDYVSLAGISTQKLCRNSIKNSHFILKVENSTRNIYTKTDKGENYQSVSSHTSKGINVPQAVYSSRLKLANLF